MIQSAGNYQYSLYDNKSGNIEFGDDDELYVIGDAIDRGPDGIKLLKHIKKQKNMDLILGNHEVL
ncbi:MAG: fructose-bisphosphatase class III [Lachnospiraceae bacterium]|nr:fructose-bisphosphatase class III [Lachnospiraceae bacterium]